MTEQEHKIFQLTEKTEFLKKIVQELNSTIQNTRQHLQFCKETFQTTNNQIIGVLYDRNNT
jgi:hypothetical protein